MVHLIHLHEKSEFMQILYMEKTSMKNKKLKGGGY